jgi:hypothetical protein
MAEILPDPGQYPDEHPIVTDVLDVPSDRGLALQIFQ